MQKLEKKVFIHHRRTNHAHALAIWNDLRAHGYEVFMDDDPIHPSEFDQTIHAQILTRAHFLVILTPSALDYTQDPNDWFRRGIDLAIPHQRHIIPILLDGFSWEKIRPHLPEALHILETYPTHYISLTSFDMSQEQLRTHFLNKPIEVALHPIPEADMPILPQKLANLPYSPTLKIPDLRAEWLFEKGNVAYHQQNYDQAIENYTESLALNPHQPLAYHRRGVSYDWTDDDRYRADYKQSIIEAGVLIAKNPRDAEAFLWRGMVELEADGWGYRERLADLTQAIRVNPTFAMAYFSRGVLYKDFASNLHAIADLTEALRLNPKDGKAYYVRGSAYFAIRKYDQAIEDFRAVLAFAPTLRDMAHNYLAMIYEKLGDDAQALAEYDQAIALNPMAEWIQKNREKLLRHIEKSKGNNP